MCLKSCIRFISCSGANCTAVVDHASLISATSDAVISSGDETQNSCPQTLDKFPTSIDVGNVASPHFPMDDKLIVQNAVITVLPSSTEEISQQLCSFEGYGLLNPSERYLVWQHGDLSSNTIHFEHNRTVLTTSDEQTGQRLVSMGLISGVVTEPDSQQAKTELITTSSSTYELTSCVNMSSVTMVIADQVGLNTIKCGPQWSPGERKKSASNSFMLMELTENMRTCEKDYSRPHVPIEFIVGRNIDTWIPQPMSASIDGDCQVGYTSTSHEIRWTLIEQEQFATHPSENGDPIDAICRILHAKGMKELKPQCSRLSFARMYKTRTLDRNSLLHLNSPKIDFDTERKLLTPVSIDDSLPMATEEVPVTLLSLNDISSHFSPAPVTTPVRTTLPKSSIPKQYTTNIVLKDPSKGTQSALISISSTSLPILKPVCTPDIPFYTHLYRKHIAIQATVEEVHLGGRALLFRPSCVLAQPPVGSEPPPASLRFVLCSRPCSPLSEIVNVEQNHTSRSDVTDVCVKAQHSAPHGRKRVRLESIINQVAPSAVIYKQPTVILVPFENIKPLHVPIVGHGYRFGKSAQFSSLDLNESEGEQIKDRTDGFGDDLKRCIRIPTGMKCVYVEVSFRQNLEGVPTPHTLSNSESKIVLLRLDRKLKGAIASHFMSFYGKVNRNNSVSPINRPAIFEPAKISDAPFRGNRNHSPCNSDKRSSSGRESIISKGSVARNQHPRPQVASGCLFSSGPQLVRPPRQWLVHIQKTGHSLESRRILAWEIDPLQLNIGGLINFNYHLEMLVSSNDGRLGIAYVNAVSLLSKIIGQSTRYTSGKVTSKGDCGQSAMHIQVHLKSSVLASFISCSQYDMSASFGLSDLGLGVHALPEASSSPKQPVKWKIIVLYTRDTMDILECELVNRIAKGIKRLREIEKELMQSVETSLSEVSPVENIQYLIKQIISLPVETKCYTRKYLNCEVYEGSLKKVTSFGGTLAHCIRGNAYCSTCPCPRAVDPECYDAFDSFFLPILDDIKKKNCMYRKRRLPQLELAMNTRIPNVLRYRVEVVRNLEGFAFPPLLTRSDYLKIEHICKRAVLSWTEYTGSAGNWYPIVSMHEEHPTLYQQLIKRGLLMPTITEEQVVSGVYRHWPEGRSVYVASRIGQTSIDLVVQLNCDDHLRVVCVDWSGKQPFAAYKKAANFVQWLDSRLPMCKHPVVGFLSPSPYNVGTGMQISALIKLAHLGRRKAELQRLCRQLNLSFSVNESGYGSGINHVFRVVHRGAVCESQVNMVPMFMSSLTSLHKADARDTLE